MASPLPTLKLYLCLLARIQPWHLKSPLSPLFRNETPPFSNASLNPPVSQTRRTAGSSGLVQVCNTYPHESAAAIATTGPCTIEAIFTINTLPCCGPVCTTYVHCLAQSPSHQSDRIKYWALSEMRPEENRLSLLCLRQTSPASVAQNGLTASSTPSSLPGNLDQPPTTSHGIMAWREECGEQNPSQVPGPVQLSTMGPALPLEVELPPLGLRPHCLREGR